MKSYLEPRKKVVVKITLLGALLSLEWAIGIGTMLDSATSKNTRGNDFQPAKQSATESWY